MGIHVKTLDTPCRECKQLLIETSMKSPHIDDFITTCDNEHCDDYRNAMSTLNSWASSNAREEEARDRYYEREEEHETEEEDT